MTAQFCVPKALIAVAPLRPATATGVVSPPKVWSPQHSTVPPARRAQVCVELATIAVTPLRPKTATGVMLY